MHKARKARKTANALVAVLLFLSILASECGAVSIIDWFLYKEVKLTTGTRILVHRITGRVGYYWQKGYRWGDAEYDREKDGSWIVPVPALKARLQQQHNTKR